MDFVNKLFNGKGYIEGITIINIEGEILFSAKFNNKLDTKDENYEVVGKKFLDIYENLDENSSTAYIECRKGCRSTWKTKSSRVQAETPLKSHPCRYRSNLGAL